MANNLTAEIGADTGKLTQSVSNAKSVLQAYRQEAKKASNEIDKNISVTDGQVKSYERVIKALDKVQSGTLSSAQQQKQLSTQIKELKIQWDNLSDSAKNGGFGASLSNTLSEAENSLERLNAQIKSVNGLDNIKPNQSVKSELKGLTNELQTLTAQYRAMSEMERNSAAGQELQEKLNQTKQRAGELKDIVNDTNEEIKNLASDTPNLDVFNQLIGIGGSALSTYSSILAKVTGDEQSLKDAISTVMMVQSATNLLTQVANALQGQSVLMLNIRKVQEQAAAAAIAIKTAAEGRGIIVTKAATLAQSAFNRVAKANPYVLLAAAVIAVGSAIYEYTKYTREAEAEEKKHQEELEKTKATVTEFGKKVADAGGDALASYERLRTEFNNLKSDHEKTEWINNNKTAFQQLGFAVNSISDAESILNSNTKAIQTAFFKRAEAAAYAAAAVEHYKKAIGLAASKQGQYKWRKFNEGDTSKGWSHEFLLDVNRQNQEALKAGKAPLIVNGTLTAEGAKILTEQSKEREIQATKEFNQNVDKMIAAERQTAAAYLQKSNELQTESNQIIQRTGHAYNGGRGSHSGGGGGRGSSGGGSGSHSNSGSNTKEEIDDVTKVINEYNDSLTNTQQALTDGIITPSKALVQTLTAQKDVLEGIEKNWDKATDKQKEFYKNVKTQYENTLSNSEAAIDEMISDLEESLKYEVNPESKKQIAKELKELKEKKAIIDVVFNYDSEDVDKVLKRKETTKSASEEFAADVDHQNNKIIAQNNTQIEANNALIDEERERVSQLSEAYDELAEKIAKANAQGLDTSEMVKDADRLKSAIDESNGKIKKASDENTGLINSNKQLGKSIDKNAKIIEGLNGLDSYISSVGGAVKTLTDDNTDGLTKVASGFQVLSDTITQVMGVMEAFSEIREMMSAANAAAAATDAAAASSEAGANTNLAMSEAAVAMGKAAVEGASVPFPLNIAAIAAGVAAVSSVISTILSLVGGFADGGIIQGSKVGDFNLARVNGGEMILNGTQQKRLFGMLNGRGIANNNGKASQVEFVIKGSNLVGVERNHFKKQSRL